VDEVLDSQSTPEEVCAHCPELLAQVHATLRKIQWLDAQLNTLFPDSAARLTTDEAELPEITGYEVESTLGRGGMGIVFRARHLRLNRPVALKMILAGPYANPDERQRFVQESEAVAALHHPNIVQVFDAGEIDGRPYFTMELVEGGRLSEKVNGVPQPGREAAELVAAIADAVHTAHGKGIVHRDLTPSNILLASDGTPKVTDFGLARRFEASSAISLTGQPIGTPSFMAPEQARGEKGAIGPATDVYALGAILYDLLTGRPPFRADTTTATLQQVIADQPVPPSRLNSRVPRDLQTICLKCLNKEPHRRYGSALELAEDLRRFLQGMPIKARPVGLIERGSRWVRRRPALASSFAAGLLLAAALIVAVVWWHGQRTALEATAVAYAEADLRESDRLRDKGEFETSGAVLERARDRLAGFVPPELHGRLAKAFENLEFVKRLDAIRLERALIKPPIDRLDVVVSPVTEMPRDSRAPRSETLSGRQYEEAFGRAGIRAPADDPTQSAARVRASPIRAAMVAALDDWAGCAADPEQQAWVLAVARRADPDTWRVRVRDAATWDNTEALRELAAQAPVAEQSPQLLAVLGARLRAQQLDSKAFMTRVVSAFPGDFWVNIEMGNALSRSDPAEAIGYYRAALALRPQTASLHYALGGVYLGQKKWDESIAAYQQAIRLDPQNAWGRNRLGFTLAWKGNGDEAIAQFREAIRLDPSNGWSHYFLAIGLENKGHLDEAAKEFGHAAGLLPEKRDESLRRQRGLMLKLGRAAEGRPLWQQELADNPAEHDAWFGYAE
jgi:serine/threonine-protein kinase